MAGKFDKATIGHSAWLRPGAHTTDTHLPHSWTQSKCPHHARTPPLHTKFEEKLNIGLVAWSSISLGTPDKAKDNHQSTTGVSMRREIAYSISTPLSDWFLDALFMPPPELHQGQSQMWCQKMHTAAHLSHVGEKKIRL